MEYDFGLVRIKVEGAPIHPDDLDWEHSPEECTKCAEKYAKQLKAYNDWEKQYYARSNKRI